MPSYLTTFRVVLRGTKEVKEVPRTNGGSSPEASQRPTVTPNGHFTALRRYESEVKLHDAHDVKADLSTAH